MVRSLVTILYFAYNHLTNLHTDEMVFFRHLTKIDTDENKAIYSIKFCCQLCYDVTYTIEMSQENLLLKTD